MSDEPRPDRRRLVQATAARLREIILAGEPDAWLGSLNEVARSLDVGIVTVQQAARVLEHEGLLEVRRGPGGGYYGKRPDDAALERSVDVYMRVHPSAHQEVREMMSLLECELFAAAARSTDEASREALRGVYARIDGADTPELRIGLEQSLREILFKMVDRPLTALLARVTSRLQLSQPAPLLFPGEETEAWKTARRRIIQAILDNDEALTRFEATRFREELISRADRVWGQRA